MTTAEAPAPAATSLIPGRRSGSSGDSRLSAVGLLPLAIAVAAFVVFRGGDLTLGLQTDELLSAWVSSDGLGETIWRAQRFQGNSAVYFVFLWAWRALVGDAELLLRLPSVAAVGLALRELVRFGRDLGSPDLGAIAGAILLGSASVTTAATTARPYGFLLLFAMVSTRSLWRYLSDGRRRHGLCWMLALVLAVSMTPFAATLGAVHATAILAWRARRPPLRSLIALTALGAALSAPLLPQVLALSDRRASLVIIAPPRPIAIVIVALPWLAVVIVGLAALVGLDAQRLKRHRHDARLVLFGAWALLPPVLLFAAGLIGDSPVFSDRYRSVGLFGGALLVGLVATSLQRRVAIVAACAIGLVSAVAIAGAAPERHGWREAIEAGADTSTLAENRVVALNPGLVESQDPANLRDPEWQPYLGAAVDHYRLDSPVVLLSENRPSDALLEERTAALFDHDVIVVVDGPPGHRWREAILTRATAAGYTVRSDTSHDALTATVLHRP